MADTPSVEDQLFLPPEHRPKGKAKNRAMHPREYEKALIAKKKEISSNSPDPMTDDELTSKALAALEQDGLSAPESTVPADVNAKPQWQQDIAHDANPSEANDMPGNPPTAAVQPKLKKGKKT